MNSKRNAGAPLLLLRLLLLLVRQPLLLVVLGQKQQIPRRRPNFIIVQPDDLGFFEEWNPPAHNPKNEVPREGRRPGGGGGGVGRRPSDGGGGGGGRRGGGGIVTYPPNYSLVNIERLRTQGLQMMQAYTSSPMCATSRYSTMSGRYPSRSSVARNISMMGGPNNNDNNITLVRVPTAKLEDVTEVFDGMDCSRNNLAKLLQQNGYRTGMTGKWHLTRTTEDFNYTEFVSGVRECGFDMAEAIYAENLGGLRGGGGDNSRSVGFWSDGSFSHNMEYITDKAVRFIHQGERNNTTDQPFFLYFNPTAPHGSGNVLEALTNFSCTNTPEGKLPVEPVITGMTAEYNGSCSEYRQTVLDRASLDFVNSTTWQNTLGAIWLDDAIGALLLALEETNQLENTFFLFQLDHGREGKSSLYETGIRVPQFIHFPAAFGTSGIVFEGLVSTIDIGPTIVDYAGIYESTSSPGWYAMDGASWKDAVVKQDEMLPFWRDERCLFFELDYDRAVRCGCDKFLALDMDMNTSSTAFVGPSWGLVADSEVLFNMCDTDGTSSIDSPNDSPEMADIKDQYPSRLNGLRKLYDMHLARTLPSNVPLNLTKQPLPTAAPATFPSLVPESTLPVIYRSTDSPSDLSVASQPTFLPSSSASTSAMPTMYPTTTVDSSAAIYLGTARDFTISLYLPVLILCLFCWPGPLWLSLPLPPWWC